MQTFFWIFLWIESFSGDVLQKCGMQKANNDYSGQSFPFRWYPFSFVIISVIAGANWLISARIFSKITGWQNRSEVLIYYQYKQTRWRGVVDLHRTSESCWLMRSSGMGWLNWPRSGCPKSQRVGADEIPSLAGKDIRFRSSVGIRIWWVHGCSMKQEWYRVRYKSFVS